MDLFEAFSKLSLSLTIIFGAYLMKLAWTPPNPIPKGTVITEYKKAYLVRLGRIFRLSRLLDYTFCGFHCILILYFPSPPKFICPNAANLSPSLFTWSLFSTLCLSMTIIFSALRLLAFKQLGRDFTFHLTTPKRLNTSGLYSVVQHPSYTAVTLSTIANSIFLYRIDGVTGCFLYESVVSKNLLINWAMFVVMAVLGAYGTMARVKKEEKILHQAFGKEWEDWNTKTKRFIPFVL